MSVLENAKQLQQMMGEGKAQDAFEKYYHEDVKVHEIPTGEVRNGKSAQREAIKQWEGMVQEVHGAGCSSVCADESAGVSTAETWMDITFQGGNRMKMEEVAVQKWQDGQIIEEKFYYNAPPQQQEQG